MGDGEKKDFFRFGLKNKKEEKKRALFDPTLSPPHVGKRKEKVNKKGKGVCLLFHYLPRLITLRLAI